jgi:hypothetical protein
MENMLVFWIGSIKRFAVVTNGKYAGFWIGSIKRFAVVINGKYAGFFDRMY